MRPPEIVGKQNPLNFGAMREVVSALGAEIVDYPQEQDCCGSTILLTDKPTALEVGRRKLESAIEAGAEMVCVCCGNCLLLLDRHQGQMGLKKRIPVVSLPQIIGLALGFPRDAMEALHH
jgi:heterodisulfide reductase subunit B